MFLNIKLDYYLRKKENIIEECYCKYKNSNK